MCLYRAIWAGVRNAWSVPDCGVNGEGGVREKRGTLTAAWVLGSRRPPKSNSTQTCSAGHSPLNSPFTLSTSRLRAILWFSSVTLPRSSAIGRAVKKLF